MNEPRFNFSGSNRLRVAAEFAAVFSSRRVLRGKFFDLHYRPSNAGEPGGARFGLVIAKKFARRSVLRNLVKRIGREAFRVARPGLPACELVLRLVSPLAPPSREARRLFRAEIDSLLSRLGSELSR